MQNRKVIVIGAVAVVAVFAALLLAGRPNTAAAAQAIAPDAYLDRFDGGTAHLLLDVRTPEEFASGHISGAINIPVDALADRLGEIPSGQPVVVYCRSGNRSATASAILIDAGYTDIYDLGGLNAWTAQGLPVE